MITAATGLSTGIEGAVYRWLLHLKTVMCAEGTPLLPLFVIQPSTHFPLSFYSFLRFGVFRRLTPSGL